MVWAWFSFICAVSLNTIVPVKIILLLFAIIPLSLCSSFFFLVSYLPDLCITVFQDVCHFHILYLNCKYTVEIPPQIYISLSLSLWLPSSILPFFISLSPVPHSVSFSAPSFASARYTTCFTRVLQKFRSPDHWAMHLIVWQGPAP